MEMNSKVHKGPDVSAEERALHDMIKRILKLRWIGMDADAEQMQRALHRGSRAAAMMMGPSDVGLQQLDNQNLRLLQKLAVSNVVSAPASTGMLMARPAPALAASHINPRRIR